MHIIQKGNNEAIMRASQGYGGEGAELSRSSEESGADHEREMLNASFRLVALRTRGDCPFCSCCSYSPAMPYVIWVTCVYSLFQGQGAVVTLSGKYRSNMLGTQKPTLLPRFALVLGSKPKRRHKGNKSHLFHCLI